MVNIVTATARPGGASSSIRASTRSPSPARPRWAASSAARPPARASGCRWSWAASRRSSSSTTPTSKRGRRRGRRDLVQPGAGLLRRLAPAGAGERGRGDLPSSARAWRSCASAIRWTRSTDIGAIVAPGSSASKIARLVQRGVKEGAEPVGSRHGPARGRLLLSADALHRCRAGLDHRAGGDLRSGAGRHELPHPAEAVALANNTRYGLAASVWSENINRRARGGGAGSRPERSGSTAPTMFDAAAGFGGYRESGFGREGGREGLVRVPHRRRAEGRKGRPRPRLRASARPPGTVACSE